MKTYVLYHGKCYDGFGAAYSAWKTLGDAAEYIPVAYGVEPPKMEKGTVYILDFSYDKDTMLKICDAMDFVVVIDHHNTAEQNFNGLSHPHLTAIFDMTKSGARLAWEFFHKDAATAPQLIFHIEDRDLWKFHIDGSKEVHKALLSYPMDFKLWDSFDVDKLKVEGIALERMHSRLVADICDTSWVGKIGKDKVPMVNTSIAWSEVGHAMLQKNPDYKYVASFTEFENEVMWSLRSRGDFDCSEVSKKYGGGGHKQASGFKRKKRKYVRKPVSGV
jgi:oligoribonuclease NrnB/cAMP/cGMP phosphodiesterase (DHH superfamily)